MARRNVLIALALVVLVLSFAGCGGPEWSPELTEGARVVETVHTPAQHGSGVGLTTGGDMAVIGTYAGAAYAVVFRCAHGKFIVEDKQLWAALSEGDSVIVHYKERAVRWYKRRWMEYDFLYAEKVQ